MINPLLPTLYALPFLALCLLPILLLMGVLIIRRRRIDAQGLKLPVETKLLRSPGEGAFNKMKGFDEKVDEAVTMFIGLPAFLMIIYLSCQLKFTHQLPGLGIIFLVMASATFVVSTFHLIRTLKQRDTWRLGFRGERAVGEILNKLMLEGCHVFHDFPLSENGNLDHVVVAPSGVYAIETKTRSKPKSSNGKHDYKITYDGKGLQFPKYYSTQDVIQAQNQADRLVKFLGSALKESIYVNPILTFPGWYVTSKSLGDVAVLNPGMIHFAIIKATPTLSPDQIERITHHLDEKCRDVEF